MCLFVHEIAQIDTNVFSPRISSIVLCGSLTRMCNETQALDRYKDELKPVFKSTPTQFQTIIFASSDKQNVGDFVGDKTD